MSTARTPWRNTSLHVHESTPADIDSTPLMPAGCDQQGRYRTRITPEDQALADEYLAEQRRREPLAITLIDGERHFVFMPEAANDEGAHPAERLMLAAGAVVLAWLVAEWFWPMLPDALAGLVVRWVGVGA